MSIERKSNFGLGSEFELNNSNNIWSISCLGVRWSCLGIDRRRIRITGETPYLKKKVWSNLLLLVKLGWNIKFNNYS